MRHVSIFFPIFAENDKTMRKIRNPWLDREGYDCFGCAPGNPIGLHMEFFEDGDDIISFWHPSEHYQGWVETLHGGILSTLIDETCGWVVMRKLQTTGVTSRLDLRYRVPVKSTDSLLTVKARLTDQKRNLVFMHATIANSNAEICVEADVVYYAMSQEKAREMGFIHCEVEDEQLLSM